MKQKVYIAGRISGREKAAEVEFAAAESILAGYGYNVINPMSLEHDHDKKWESYMRTCIAELVTCSAIFFLPEWEKSNGARLEFLIAVNLGLRIVYNFKTSM